MPDTFWNLMRQGMWIFMLAILLATPAFALNTDHDQDGLTDAYETGISTDHYDSEICKENIQ
jgi:hypothetical protein